MKITKVSLIVGLVLIFTMEIMAQSVTVPANIKAEFDKSYANATEVIWDKDKDYWEAEFMWNNEKAEVKYDMNGNLYSEELKLTEAELPAAVRTSLNRDYSGLVITEIEKETEKGVTVYEVEFTHGGKDHEVEYDKSGQVVKK